MGQHCRRVSASSLTLPTPQRHCCPCPGPDHRGQGSRTNGQDHPVGDPGKAAFALKHHRRSPRQVEILAVKWVTTVRRGRWFRHPGRCHFGSQTDAWCVEDCTGQARIPRQPRRGTNRTTTGPAAIAGPVVVRLPSSCSTSGSRRNVAGARSAIARRGTEAGEWPGSAPAALLSAVLAVPAPRMCRCQSWAAT